MTTMRHRGPAAHGRCRSSPLAHARIRSSSTSSAAEADMPGVRLIPDPPGRRAGRCCSPRPGTSFATMTPMTPPSLTNTGEVCGPARRGGGGGRSLTTSPENALAGNHCRL